MSRTDGSHVRCRIFATVTVTLGACYFVALGAVWWNAKVFLGEAESQPLASGPAWAVVFFTEDPDMRTARITRAIALLREGRVDGIYMVGGFRPNSAASGSTMMLIEAEAMGAPLDHISRDEGSNDTWSNVTSAERFAAGIPGCRLQMVSDYLHIARISSIVMIQGLKQPVGYAASRETWSLRTHWSRLNHELLAWVFMLVPRETARELLLMFRRALPEAPVSEAADPESFQN